MTMTTGDSIAEKFRAGKVDVMSLAAARARVPLCGYRGCTRAAGHDEIIKNNSTAPLHVVTDHHYLIIEVVS